MQKYNEYGSLVMPRQRQVFAKMWLPYSKTPHVENVYETVNAPMTAHMRLETDAEDLRHYGSSLISNKKICDHGLIKYEDGSTEQIKPREYVLYHKQALKPVGKISEEKFLKEFVEGVQLCEPCQERLSKANAPIEYNMQGNPLEEKQRPEPKITNHHDIIKTFGQGKSITIPNPDGTATVLKDIRDLREYARKNNVDIK